MLCIKCSTQNENDALFCKKCGTSLIEDYKSNYDKKDEKNSNQKPKKNKIKTKTKVKKVKDKSKNRRNRDNKSSNKGNNVVVERKMSVFQKIFVFLLVLFIIILLGVIGVMGYGLYVNYAIDVPNVVGMSYSEAELTLARSDLKIQKNVVTVTDSVDNDIVIKQNKKAFSKVIKNTVVKVTVGVVDDSYTMPNFVGKNIDDVTSILDNASIKYKITIKEVESGSDNVVLVQSISANKRIKTDDTVKLIVSKVIITDDNKDEDTTKEDTTDDSSLSSNDDSVDSTTSE